MTLGTTPDRRPGPLIEDEEVRLGPQAAGPTQAGAITYTGSEFQAWDGLGVFNLRLGSGVSTVDFLLAVPPVSPGITYVPTYVSGRVTEEEWKKTSGGTRVRLATYSYTGGVVTGEVVKVYGPDGMTVIGQVTWSYSYAGGRLTGGTMTRDV